MNEIYGRGNSKQLYIEVYHDEEPRSKRRNKDRGPTNSIMANNAV